MSGRFYSMPDTGERAVTSLGGKSGVAEVAVKMAEAAARGDR